MAAIVPRHLRRRKRVSISKVVCHLVLYVICAIWAFPTIWALVTSFKPAAVHITIPPTVIFKPVLDSWTFILSQDLLLFMRNSVMLALISSFFAILLGVPAAYGLIRFRFRGRDELAFGVFALRFLPYISIALPLYFVLKRLGLLGTLPGLTLSYQLFLLPIAIWLLRSFFAEIPQQCEEAAMVDGTTRWGAFLRISLPLALPGIGAALILCFVFSWNELLIPLMMAGRDLRPMVVGLTRYQAGMEVGTRWGLLGAWSSATIFPVIVFVFIVGKHFVSGFQRRK